MTSPVQYLAGVCGWPIHHSLSPLMHNFWLQKMNIPGAYVSFAVRPDEALRAFSSLPYTSISGVNITAPLKRAAYEAAVRVTSDAKKLGAANCLIVRDGKLHAHNTDLEGFAAPLLASFGAKKVMKNSALIFGTGGAAEAVVESMIRLNSPEIRLCGRTNSKAEAMVGRINLPSVTYVPWENRQAALSSAGLIINATSAGMAGKPALDVNLDPVLPDSFVYDLVYTPQITPLLSQAVKFGLPHIGGLDMLVAQARPSFRLFYGQEPSPDLDPKPLLIKALNKGQNQSQGYDDLLDPAIG